MARLKLGHAALLCGSLALTSGARAADSTSAPAPNRAEGKARYERGVEAYSSGRFADAVELFLQADALAPSAALSFNIAKAYERIGDDASALRWYRDFRRRAPQAKNGSEVDGWIRKLEGELAKKGVQQVTVLSEPAGATVVIDDKPLGVTPFTGQLAPGKHRVVLTLKGYNEAERELSLSAERAQDLRISLEQAASGAPSPSPAAPPLPRGREPERRPAGARFGPWPWVSVAAGGAMLGASLGFELARRSAEEAAKNEPTQVGYQEKLDTEQSRRTTARVLLGAGSALVVTGGVLLVLDWTSRGSADSSRRAQLGGLCLPGACALNVRGEF
jgi:tetratricopeptide (TPR) repeat protein